MRDGVLYYGGKEVVPWEDRIKFIGKMYKDPRSTGGRDRLFQHIYEKYAGISSRDVADYLANSETHQLHQPLPKRLTSRPVTVSLPNRYAQVDLIDLEELQGYNNHKRYILTFIDIYSKWCAARALTNKTGPAVEAALLDILPDTNVSTIQTDNGAEFGPSLKRALADIDIKLIHSSPYNPRANGIVERFNGYLKRTLYRLMDANHTKKWIDILPTVIDNYNNTTHRITGWKPIELKDEKLTPQEAEDISSRMISITPTESASFNKGDVVRLALTVEPAERRKGSFRKSYKINWTEDLFEILTVSNPSNANSLPQYTVKNLETGVKLRKKLYPYQLQKVDPDKLIVDDEPEEPEAEEPTIDDVEAPESKEPIVPDRPKRVRRPPREPVVAESKPMPKPKKVKEPEPEYLVKAIHGEQKVRGQTFFNVEWARTIQIKRIGLGNRDPISKTTSSSKST